MPAGGLRGFDPGKRHHGRKRQIVTDTNGLLLAALVHPANVQNVHGAVPLLRNRLAGLFEVDARPERVCGTADSGHLSGGQEESHLISPLFEIQLRRSFGKPSQLVPAK